jgi:hypothetical protein
MQVKLNINLRLALFFAFEIFDNDLFCCLLLLAYDKPIHLERMFFDPIFLPLHAHTFACKGFRPELPKYICGL